MELFLISNLMITLAATLYNRYGRVSISAKLTVSTFALICWVIPFTLIRNYLPQEVAVNVHWLVPLQNSINQVTVTTPMQASWLSQLNLSDILVFAGMIGLVFMLVRLFKHQQWINRLKNDPQTKLVCQHLGKPVYQSNKIDNQIQ